MLSMIIILNSDKFHKNCSNGPFALIAIAVLGEDECKRQTSSHQTASSNLSFLWDFLGSFLSILQFF